MIEEKQDQSKKFSSVRITIGSLIHELCKKQMKIQNFHDLSHIFFQVHQLQEQVSHLADSQATTDERYSKVKQENASLNQK